MALAVALALAGASASAEPARAQVVLDSECQARVLPDIGPAVLPLSGRLRVVDRIEIDCPRREVRAFHLMVVADAGAPVGECLKTLPGPDRSACWLERVLPALEDRIDLSANPLAKAGLVAYGRGYDLVCDPTADAHAFEACVARYVGGRVRAGGVGGALDEGIEAALKRLVQARGTAVDRGQPIPVTEGIVALVGADPFQDDAACDGARQAIAYARSNGVPVDVVCAQGDCAATCLADVGGERFTPSAGWRGVVDYLGGQAWSTELRVLQLTVHERLGGAFTLVDGSIAPAANAVWDAAQRSITWSFDARNRDFVTLEYALAPTRVGRLAVRPSVNGSYGIMADSRGRTHAFGLGNAEVFVGAAEFTALLPALHRGSCGFPPCIRTALAGPAPER